jgi:GTPase SAR1 family protein
VATLFVDTSVKAAPQTSSDAVPNPHDSTCDNSGGPQKQNSVEKIRLVLIMGDRSVGKTALLQQFMTSDYMAAMNTSFDGKCMNRVVCIKMTRRF